MERSRIVGDWQVPSRCFTSERSINLPTGITFTKIVWLRNWPTFTQIVLFYATTSPRAPRANRPGRRLRPSQKKVCCRRFPRWVMWCGMPGTTTRANRAMRPPNPRLSLVKIGMVSPGHDQNLVGDPERPWCKAAPTSSQPTHRQRAAVVKAGPQNRLDRLRGDRRGIRVGKCVSASLDASADVVQQRGQLSGKSVSRPLDGKHLVAAVRFAVAPRADRR